MNKAFEIQNLKSSWTKFDAVKVIDIVLEEDPELYLRGKKEINLAVLRNFLGIEKNTDPNPVFWKKLKDEPEIGRLFACIAAIMTHHDLISRFADKYSTENMGGIFQMTSDSKVDTNIRRALIDSGASDKEYINSQTVPYDFSELFKSGIYGKYFLELIYLRLSKIGWGREDIKDKYFDLSVQYGIHRLLGLTEDQLKAWLSGEGLISTKSIPKIKKPSIELEGLIENSKVTKTIISKRENPLDILSISKSKIIEYEKNGWNLVSQKKNVAKVQKPKSHDIAFEDDLWALMAKMEFDFYNLDRNFRIKFHSDSGVVGKQIDVFAGDKESVILIECKSSEKKNTYSFQKDIDQIANNKQRINGVIRKFFDSKPRIAYVFCTNNVLISEGDRVRMKENNIIHLNQDDITYYKNLTSLLGRASKYQFLGSIFEGIEIPELPNKVPAVKGKMGGYDYYSFLIEPETLLKIGFVLHRNDASDEAFDSYQRMVQKARINSIRKYIDEEKGYFPNSIIVNINSGKQIMEFQPSPICERDSVSKIGILNLPKKYKSAFIIDGQHRLYGYSKSVWRSRNTIPVVAFENLPAKEQSKLFIDINHTQKSVKKNLLLSLISDFNWDSTDDDEALLAVRIKLIQLLENKEESPLYKRIITAEQNKTNQRCLTLDYIHSYGLKSNTNFFGITKNKKLIKQGYFTGPDHKSTLNKAYKYLVKCFHYIEKSIPEQWELGSSEGGFIAMNIGITSIMRILNDILDHIESTKKIIIQSKTADELYDETHSYLKILVKYLSVLSPDQKKNLRSYLGAAGTNHVVRELQKAIHSEIDEFNPDGLVDWINTQSGQYNQPSKIIGDKMQLEIRGYIFKELKRIYGEKDKAWWVNGVPINIQQHCSDRYIEEKRIEPEENYLDTIHYLEIIKMKDHKQEFINTFTPPGSEQEKEDNKTKWFINFNSIRKKYSHPERKNVSEEDLKFLEELQRWLLRRLT